MSNPNVAKGNVRPGLKAGQVNEFTLIMNLKPGGAERLRKKLASDSKLWKSKSSLLSIELVRFMILGSLFSTMTPDSYLRRLLMAIGMRTLMTLVHAFPTLLIMSFGEADDYPGIKSPDIKDFIVKHQVTSTYFYSAYPNASVRDVWKAMKVKGGLDVLLDAASS